MLLFHRLHSVLRSSFSIINYPLSILIERRAFKQGIHVLSPVAYEFIAQHAIHRLQRALARNLLFTSDKRRASEQGYIFLDLRPGIGEYSTPRSPRRQQGLAVI